LAEWKFELWITQTASAEYEELKGGAEAAVLGYEGPLPINADPRLLPRLAVVDHFERTRRLLRSIRKPEDAGLDKGLSGPLHFVRYRAESGTCVYFTRIVTTPPAVLVYAFSNSPLDRMALRRLILSGNAHLLEKLGLPPIPTADTLYVN
jgi:hypothetical protein